MERAGPNNKQRETQGTYAKSTWLVQRALPSGICWMMWHCSMKIVQPHKGRAAGFSGSFDDLLDLVSTHVVVPNRLRLLGDMR
jgi:hypothetical protein